MPGDPPVPVDSTVVIVYTLGTSEGADSWAK
jgi:hypothetical protein